MNLTGVCGGGSGGGVGAGGGVGWWRCGGWGRGGRTLTQSVGVTAGNRGTDGGGGGHTNQLATRGLWAGAEEADSGTGTAGANPIARAL